jgi:catechol 2,3-dioxygenase-like lactoylglutathione lyase family enzyme
MAQQGQVFKMRTRGADGKPTWAYRYRVDGRGSARPQVGGFASQGEAVHALKVALERLHRRNGRVTQITLSELAEEYLAQHEREDAAVRAFHAAALAAGYKDHGAPGERAVYHPGYYGAFVLDPDGHNVEVVNHNRG